MTDNTVSVTLTEDEIKQIASGNVSIALRNKLGLKSFLITVTRTYELLYTEADPFLVVDGHGDEQAIFTVEALDEAFEKNPDLTKESILYDCDYTDYPTISITVTYDGRTVEIEP